MDEDVLYKDLGDRIRASNHDFGSGGFHEAFPGLMQKAVSLLVYGIGSDPIEYVDGQVDFNAGVYSLVLFSSDFIYFQRFQNGVLFDLEIVPRSSLISLTLLTSPIVLNGPQFSQTTTSFAAKFNKTEILFPMEPLKSNRADSEVQGLFESLKADLQKPQP